jgi:hypothetical protein
MSEEITADNCTADEIIDVLGEEMDFMEDPQAVKWKAYFTQQAYDKVKNDPDNYIYEVDGVEYVKVWDNHVIPFVIDMRVAGIDNDISKYPPYFIGCRRAIDEGK